MKESPLEYEKEAAASAEALSAYIDTYCSSPETGSKDLESLFRQIIIAFRDSNLPSLPKEIQQIVSHLSKENALSVLLFSIGQPKVFNHLLPDRRSQFLNVIISYFRRNKDLIKACSEVTIPTMSLYSEFTQGTVVISPDSINPLAYACVQEVFSNLHGYLPLIHRDSEYRGRILLAAFAFGMFDKGVISLTYRQLLTPTITDYDPQIIQDLRYIPENKKDSPRLDFLKTHLRHTSPHFYAQVQNWVQRDELNTRHLADEILMEEHRGRTQNLTYTQLASQRQGEHALATQMFRSQKIGYERHSYEALEAYGFPSEIPARKLTAAQIETKAKDQLHRQAYRQLYGFLMKYRGQILHSIKSDGEEAWTHITHALEMLQKSTNTPLSNGIDKLPTIKATAHEKIALFILVLETEILEEVKDRADQWEFLYELKTCVFFRLKEYHDNTPLPIDLPPADLSVFNSSATWDKFNEEGRLAIQDFTLEDGCISSHDKHLTALIEDREAFVLEMEDEYRKSGMTLFKETPALRLMELVSASMFHLGLWGIPAAVALGFIFDGKSNFTPQQVELYLKTYIPAAIYSLSLTTRFYGYREYDRVSYSKYEPMLKSTIQDALSRKKKILNRQLKIIRNKTAVLLLAFGLLSVAPETLNFAKDSGILSSIDRLIRQKATEASQTVDNIGDGLEGIGEAIGNFIAELQRRNIVNQNEKGKSSADVVLEGMNASEFFAHKYGASALPRNVELEKINKNNHRYRLRVNGLPPTFLVGQTCQVPPSPSQEGCLQRENGEYLDTPLSSDHLFAIHDEGVFTSLQDQLVNEGKLTLLSTESIHHIEVPVGFIPTDVYWYKPTEGTLGASWNPFGGIALEGEAAQILVAYQRVGSNTQLAPYTGTLPLLNADSLPDQTMAESFKGRDVLTEITNQVKKMHAEGVSKRTVMEWLYQKQRELGIIYQGGDFSPDPYTTNAQIAGALYSEPSLICNQSSWLIPLVMQDAGYKDVALVRGFANYSSAGGIASDRDAHQIVVYLDEADGTWKTFDATLPSTSQLDNLNLLTEPEKYGLDILRQASDRASTLHAVTSTPHPTTPVPTLTEIPPTFTSVPSQGEQEHKRRLFIVQTNGSKANIRQSANFSAGVVAQANDGDRLLIFQETSIGDGSKWYEVLAPESSVRGWIHDSVGYVETETQQLPPMEPTTIPPTPTFEPNATLESAATLIPTNLPPPTTTPVFPNEVPPSPTPTEIPLVEQPQEETVPPNPLIPLAVGGAALAGAGGVLAVRRYRQRQAEAARKEEQRRQEDIRQQRERERIELRWKVVPIVGKYFKFLVEFYHKQGELIFENWENMAHAIAAQLLSELEGQEQTKRGFVLDKEVVPLPSHLQARLVGNVPFSANELLEEYKRPDTINEIFSVGETLQSKYNVSSELVSKIEGEAMKRSVRNQLSWKKLLQEAREEHALSRLTDEEITTIVEDLKRSYSLFSEQSRFYTAQGIEIVKKDVLAAGSTSPKIPIAVEMFTTLQQTLS